MRNYKALMWTIKIIALAITTTEVTSIKLYSIKIYILLLLLPDLCHISDSNGCDSTPCEHGGTCITELDVYSCLCEEGYEGQHCQIGEQLIYIYYLLIIILTQLYHYDWLNMTQ